MLIDCRQEKHNTHYCHQSEHKKQRVQTITQTFFMFHKACYWLMHSISFSLYRFLRKHTSQRAYKCLHLLYDAYSEILIRMKGMGVSLLSVFWCNRLFLRFLALMPSVWLCIFSVYLLNILSPTDSFNVANWAQFETISTINFNS